MKNQLTKFTNQKIKNPKAIKGGGVRHDEIIFLDEYTKANASKTILIDDVIF